MLWCALELYMTNRASLSVLRLTRDAEKAFPDGESTESHCAVRETRLVWRRLKTIARVGEFAWGVTLSVCSDVLVT
jgi:hypothetical protein